MKNLLLLGDSIRGNYRADVVKLLEGKANVYGPDENCRFANYTLNSLRHWLPNYPNPDIIHWNNGIWDAVDSYDEGHSFTFFEDYLRDCARILRILREKTGAKVIFALTTPIRNPVAAKNIIRNNTAIEAYMRSEGVPVNDLYSVVYANMDEYICEDGTHLTAAGALACAKAITHAVEPYLAD